VTVTVTVTVDFDLSLKAEFSGVPAATEGGRQIEIRMQPKSIDHVQYSII
jgi:hypothetical protein